MKKYRVISKVEFVVTEYVMDNNIFDAALQARNRLEVDVKRVSEKVSCAVTLKEVMQIELIDFLIRDHTAKIRLYAKRMSAGKVVKKSEYTKADISLKYPTAVLNEVTMAILILSASSGKDSRRIDLELNTKKAKKAKEVYRYIKAVWTLIELERICIDVNFDRSVLPGNLVLVFSENVRTFAENIFVKLA